MARYKKFAPVELNLDPVDVWNAAAVAYRMNGGYLKEDRYDFETEKVTPSNRAIVKSIVGLGSKIEYELLPSDVELAAAARAHYAGNLIALLNDQTNGFMRSAITAAGAERINTNMELGLIASLIKTYLDEQARAKINETKESLGSVHVGAVKEKICFANPNIIECRFVQNIGAYSVEAVVKGNLFKWWSTDKVELGEHREITGRVKRHESDYRTGVPVTALNYVKIK